MATASVVYESNKVRKIISVKIKSYQRKIAERNKWLEIQIIVKKKKRRDVGTVKDTLFFETNKTKKKDIKNVSNQEKREIDLRNLYFYNYIFATTKQEKFCWPITICKREWNKTTYYSNERISLTGLNKTSILPTQLYISLIIRKSFVNYCASLWQFVNGNETK